MIAASYFFFEPLLQSKHSYLFTFYICLQGSLVGDSPSSSPALAPIIPNSKYLLKHDQSVTRVHNKNYGKSCVFFISFIMCNNRVNFIANMKSSLFLFHFFS